MKSKFVRNNSQLKEDPTKDTERRVMKVEMPVGFDVQDYGYQKIVRKEDGDYSRTKKVYGIKASTEKEQSKKKKRDDRFKINPLLKAPLGVEDEERRVIEQLVAEGIKSAEADARKKAAEKGYEEGYKEGYDKAYDKYRQEGTERLNQLREFLKSCESAKVDIFKANERVLIDLVYRIAKKVIEKELETDREYVKRILLDVIDKVGVRENIRLKVNPDDLVSVEKLEKDLKDQLGNLENLNIDTSNKIPKSGCTVETEWNVIDASLETKFKGVYDALVGKQ